MNPTGTPHPRTPWHLWAVGALGLLWNAYGAMDYFLSKTQGDVYLRSVGMSQAQIDHFHAMPAWMTAVWAVGVWGAVLGTVLLLFRRRLAAPVFLASLLAFVMSLVHAHAIDPLPESNSPAMMGMQSVILAGCLLFAWYAQAQSKSGVLR
ncbi:MAG: hypothetical protein ACK527_19920 [Acidobacteriota bacterium]